MNEISDMCWVINPDLVVCTSPKAGFRSFCSCGIHEKISKEEARERGMVIRLYIRNPLERPRSAWAMYEAAGNHCRHCVGWPDWETFIDRVLDGWRDEHWLPQMELHQDIDEIYRLETIKETWPGDYIGHVHKTRIEKPALGYRLDDLKHYYAADTAAWETARF